MCNVLEEKLEFSHLCFFYDLALIRFVSWLCSSSWGLSRLQARRGAVGQIAWMGYAFTMKWLENHQSNKWSDKGCMHTSRGKNTDGAWKWKTNPPLTSLLDPGVPQRSCLLGNYMVVEKERNFIPLALTNCCTQMGAILRPLTSWIDPPYNLT